MKAFCILALASLSLFPATGQISTAKILAGPIAQNVTDHSATIFWITRENAPTRVNYGTDQDSMKQIATAAAVPPGENGEQEHRAQLENLSPDQNYYFVIPSDSGTTAARGQFQTEPSGYAQIGKLRITDGPVFEYIDGTSAQIAWTTNSPSSTLVRYGNDPNDLRKTAQAPWGKETHRVLIRNLKPNTRYYFVVESGDARGSGSMAKSAEGSFRTVEQGEAALRNIEPRR